MSDEFASKAAQEKAQELGIDAHDIQGTGQEGRIRVEDVNRAASESGNAQYWVSHETDGEYVVTEVDEDGNAFSAVVIPSATVVPLSASEYDKLPKDESSGELAWPLVEQKKGDS